MSDLEVTTLEDVISTLTAGFVIVAANIIQSRDPNKTFEDARVEALFQIVEAKRYL
jgi:hypothetical protein